MHLSATVFRRVLYKLYLHDVEYSNRAFVRAGPRGKASIQSVDAVISEFSAIPTAERTGAIIFYNDRELLGQLPPFGQYGTRTKRECIDRSTVAEQSRGNENCVSGKAGLVTHCLSY